MKQYQTDDIKELAAALAKAQGEMTHAGKGVKNEFFKSKYADLPAVIDAAKEALAKNGLSVTQMTDFDEAGNITLVTQLTHLSGQWMRSWYPVKPVKNDPQGLGSAITYARRYAYSAIVGVAAADEDDDGNAASGNVTPQKEAKSIFANAALRKAWCENAVKSYNAAESVAELNSLFTDDKNGKLKDMKESGNEWDAQGAEEVYKQYRAKLADLKQMEALTAGMPEDFNNTK